MKKMLLNKKGFTLIELLAVIVILAIITVITVPKILDIIEKSRMESFKDSAGLMADSARIMYATGKYSGETEYVFEEGDYSSDSAKLNFKGDKPYSGIIKVNKNGRVSLALISKNKKYCATKEYTGSVKVKLEDGVCETSGGLEASTENDVKPDEPSVPVPEPVTFEGDSWKTIVKCAKEGNCPYEVGATKEVDLGELGVHTLRIANTSTPEECSTAGFSQTACGFVIEFADIITAHQMNSTDTNIGGWRDSEMRTYVNDNIYNSLPSEIKENIINTYVVSGHGSNDSLNIESTDKIYLLSPNEIYGKTYTYDTISEKTRQLDYYKSIGVTTDSYSGAIKKYNDVSGIYINANFTWFLRSSYSNGFIFTSEDGSGLNYIGAKSSNGVSPAFRIG